MPHKFRLFDFFCNRTTYGCLKMRKFVFLSIGVLLVQQIVAPPVTKNTDEEHKKNEVDEQSIEDNVMVFEYERYLQEVIQALESDPGFRAKLEKAEETDIRSGKIATELEYVSHHVRTKLDEVKRAELERLKELIRRKRELDGDEGVSSKIADHLDHANRHTFEIEDLKKLIRKTNEDLAEADEKRKEEFKTYEMQKKFEEEHKMKGKSGMSEEEKHKYAEELKNMKEKHKQHDPLHHPGSKQQLEEVWEKQDHMEDQEFNPKTFFILHDLDGNGYWDQDEVKALFIKELDKMYSSAPEDDLRERIEEMERMREHVFSEADTNHDGFIDYEEFLAQTKRDEFQKDPGWKPLDEQDIYSQQEYEAFEKQREEEIQKLIAQGLIQPDPNYGLHEQFPPQHHPDAANQVYHQGQAPVQQQQQHHQGQAPQVPQAGQQYQPPPQQIPRDQVPVSGQFQPPNVIHQQPVNNLNSQASNQQAVNQVQNQQIPQQANAAQNPTPNVVRT